MAWARPKLINKLDSVVLDLLLVAIGSVPAALMRWKFNNELLANLIGSFILGTLISFPFNFRRQLLIGVGFCGSLTTFSSWIIKAVLLLEEGAWMDAVKLIACSLVLGLFAALLGLAIGKQLRMRGLAR